MLSAYKMFLDDDDARAEVISIASRNIGIPEDRVSKYYESEVSNFLDGSSIEGLKVFLNVVCGMEQDPCWLETTQSE